MKRSCFLFVFFGVVFISAYAADVAQRATSDIPVVDLRANDAARREKVVKLVALLRQFLRRDLDGLTIMSLIGDAATLSCDNYGENRRCVAAFRNIEDLGESRLSYMTKEGGGFNYVSVDVDVTAKQFCIKKAEVLDEVNLGEDYYAKEGFPIRHDELAVDADGNYYIKPDPTEERSWRLDYKWKFELKDRHPGIWLGDALAFVKTKRECIASMSAKRLYLDKGIVK